MSINTDQSKQRYAGNNSTATAYVIPFRFDDPSWLSVTRVTSVGLSIALINGIDFSLEDQDLRTTAAIPSSEMLEVRRNTPVRQTLETSGSEASYSRSLEKQLDETTMAIQDLSRNSGLVAAQLILDQAAMAAATATSGAAAAHSDALSAAASAAALSALQPAFINEQAVQDIAAQIMAYTAAPDPEGLYITMGGNGDSIADSVGVVPYLMHEFSRRFGIGALASVSFARPFGPEYLMSNPDTSISSDPAFTGGASNATSANGGFGVFTYLPNGVYYKMPAGSTATEAPFQKYHRHGWKKATFFFAKHLSVSPFAGASVTITVSQDGVTTATKLINSAQLVGSGLLIVDVTAADGLRSYGYPKFTVSVGGGEVHYIGMYLYKRSGTVPACMSYGGSGIAQQAIAPVQNWIDYANAINLKLLVHAFKIGLEGSWPSGSDVIGLASFMQSNFPNVSHLWLTQTPSSVDTQYDVPASVFIKAAAISQGHALFDAHLWLKDYAKVVANNWQGDTTHLTEDARRWQAAAIWQVFFKSALAPDSQYAPVLRSDLNDDFLTRKTGRSLAMLSDNTSGKSAGASAFTTSQSDNTKQVYWVTQPAANSIAYFVLGKQTYFYGRLPFRARWQQLQQAINPDATMWMKFGNSETLDILPAKSGLAVKTGVDSNGPYCQIYLHDGSAGGLFSSPKYYIPTHSEIGGYGYGGGGVENWAVDYDGKGGALTKRVRVFFAPGNPQQGSIGTVRPWCVADWSVTVNDANSSPQTEAMTIWQTKIDGSPVATAYTTTFLVSCEIDTNVDVYDSIYYPY